MERLGRGFDRVINRFSLWLVAVVAVGVIGILYWQLTRSQEQLVEATARQHAAAYAEALSSVRTLYTSAVVAPARRQGMSVSHDYRQREGIPLPATFAMELGAHMDKEGSGSTVRLYSPYPFPWRSDLGGLQDAFARDAWTAVNADPTRPFYRIEDRSEGRVLRYATADVLRTGCVSCHNSHPDTPKSGWREGDVRGILEVSFPIERASQLAEQGTNDTFFFLAPLIGLALLVFGVATVRRRRWSRAMERQVDSQTVDLRKREEELLRAREYAGGILQSCPVGLLVVNQEGTIERANDVCSTIFGYSESELVGQSVDLLVPEAQRGSHVAQRHGFVHARSAERYAGRRRMMKMGREVQGLHKDGSTLPVQVSISVANVGSRKLMIVGVSDRTESKKAETTRRRIENDLARASGMAEVATGVIHNVGNIVTSMNTSAHLALEAMQHTSLGRLKKAVALLNEHADDPPSLQKFLTQDRRGPQLAEYLAAISERLTHEYATVEQELKSLQESVQDTIAAVASQQEFARSVPFLEQIELETFLERAVALSGIAEAVQPIRVERHFDCTAPVVADRHRLLQILVNLLKNAKQALKDAAEDQPVITLRTTQGLDDTVVVSVCDNGHGIAPENLTRIFTHGFSTRKGAAGFGLHHSATSATEMEAKLTAESPGAGRGASFHLVLKRRSKKAA